jgi:hypothetical protein
VAAAGGSFTYDRFVFGINDFVVQPSIPAPGVPFVTAANGTEYLMEAVGPSSIRIWAISNTNNIVSSPTSLRANSVTISSQNFVGSTVPSQEPNVIGPYCTSVGATSAPTIDAGYNAFQATVQMAAGNLYGALAYAATDGNGLQRDNIAWFAVTPSVNSSGVPSASIASQGAIAATNGYSLSYPAFGLNSTGAGYLGVTETNISSSVAAGYPSASILQFTGSGITGGFLVTGQGFTSDDGFSGCSGAGPAGVGRWGDYGAAVVDAVTGYFYTANEMIPNPSQHPRGSVANWGTFITLIAPNGLPEVTTNTHDFNADGKSDIAWRNGTTLAFWLMNGAGISSSGAVSGLPTTWSVVGQRDFNGDGKADLLLRDTSGNIAMWFMNGTAVGSSVGLGNLPTNWFVAGTGDFNGDGLGDILWRDSAGDIAVWLMNGASVTSAGVLGNLSTTTWTVAAVADFNGDGKADILWRDSSGNMYIWFMNGTAVGSSVGVGNLPTNWSMAGTGDFNGDGRFDIVWQDTVGDTAIWLMNGAAVLNAGSLGTIPTTLSIVQTGDYNGDGRSDLLWRDTSGNTFMWFMNGLTVSSTGNVGNIPTVWTVQAVNAD